MSTRQLRARLDRLTRFARTAVGQDRDGVHNFTNSGRTHSQEEAKRAVDAAIPAATGVPHTMMEHIREAVKANVSDGELTRLLCLPAEKLIGDLDREHLVSLIVANRLARERALEDKIPPTELAKVGQASGNTLLANANAKARQAATAPPAVIPGDNAKVTEHDDLDPAWQKFREERAKLTAA
jgi:hypothetical protein